MTLREWVNEMVASVQEFAEVWSLKHETDPTLYPLEMDLGDWSLAFEDNMDLLVDNAVSQAAEKYGAYSPQQIVRILGDSCKNPRHADEMVRSMQIDARYCCLFRSPFLRYSNDHT